MHWLLRKSLKDMCRRNTPACGTAGKTQTTKWITRVVERGVTATFQRVVRIGLRWNLGDGNLEMNVGPCGVAMAAARATGPHSPVAGRQVAETHLGRSRPRGDFQS